MALIDSCSSNWWFHCFQVDGDDIPLWLKLVHGCWGINWWPCYVIVTQLTRKEVEMSSKAPDSSRCKTTRAGSFSFNTPGKQYSSAEATSCPLCEGDRHTLYGRSQKDCNVSPREPSSCKECLWRVALDSKLRGWVRGYLITRHLFVRCRNNRQVRFAIQSAIECLISVFNCSL